MKGNIYIMGPVGFEPSVRIPQTKNTTFKIQNEQYGYNKDTMRDLYHRKDRVNLLDKKNRFRS